MCRKCRSAPRHNAQYLRGLESDMTTLEIKLDLPDRMAREVEAAGLLTPKALRELLKDAMRRRAAQTLLNGAARATEAGSKALSMKEIQVEVAAVRRDRHAKGASGA